VLQEVRKREEEIFFARPLIFVAATGLVIEFMIVLIKPDSLGAAISFPQSVCTLVIVRRDCVGDA
jgi:hypothetical protein